MDKAFLTLLGKELGVISATEEVHGGDINTTFIIHSDQQKCFLKLNSDDHADMFEKEFKGLELIRNSNVIRTPKALLHGKHAEQIYLVMEYIERGKPSPFCWQIFAKQLSQLHSKTAETFGLEHDNYIGSLPQPNKQAGSWSEFYATQRVLFLVKKAYDEKKCDSSDIKLAEKLCNRLDSLFPNERPSMLHGDLWSGNFMIDEAGSPVIYDPAVYYGHREMDIGMSLLFGGFDKTFYDHYNEYRPLEKNWQQRTDLTQLYPLLAHLVLFGGHYYHSMRDILKKYN